MRKILALLLTLCLVIGLTACSGISGQNLADNAGSGNSAVCGTDCYSVAFRRQHITHSLP